MYVRLDRIEIMGWHIIGSRGKNTRTELQYSLRSLVTVVSIPSPETNMIT